MNRSANSGGIVLLAIVVAFAIGYFDVIWGVGSRWMHFTEAYSDGWLMFAISIGLVVRQYFRSWPVYQPQVIWLAPLLMATFLSLLGAWLYVEAVQEFLLVPILLASLGAVWGWRQLERFLIPVGLLFMVIPFWDFLAWPLQVTTVQANKVLLGLLGIDFHVDGVYVYLHNIGAFEVAGGCSGLRYLIVAMSLCLIFGHLTFRRWRTVAKFVATGAVFGIVTNWFRVFVVILVGYESNMKSSLVHHHDFFGWCLFGVILIPLFWLGERYSRSEKPQPSREAASDPTQQPGNVRAQSLPIWVFAVALLILVLPRGVDALRPSASGSAVPGFALNAPAGWLPAFSQAPDGWKPISRGADARASKHWVRLNPAKKGIGGELSGYVATYLSQRPGKELIQYANHVFDSDQWAPRSSFELKGPDGQRYSGLKLQRRSDGKVVYVAYGYYVSGAWVTDEIEAKLAQVIGLFTHRHDSSLIAVGLDCKACEDPKAELAKAMETLAPQAEKTLDRYDSNQ